MSPNTVINFWFDDIQPSQWWQKDLEFDSLILDRYSILHTQASQGELYEWRKSPEGALAEIIVLDQFSRNMFRGTAQSFAYDGMALILAQEAVSKKQDQALPTNQKAFLYMPYMHSESRIIHQQAEALFSQQGMESNLEFERQHKVIIDTFGRYPHRNAILGRESTEEECQFLTTHTGF